MFNIIWISGKNLLKRREDNNLEGQIPVYIEGRNQTIV